MDHPYIVPQPLSVGFITLQCIFLILSVIVEINTYDIDGERLKLGFQKFVLLEEGI